MSIGGRPLNSYGCENYDKVVIREKLIGHEGHYSSVCFELLFRIGFYRIDRRYHYSYLIEGRDL